jgi:hypothetical protein
MNITELAKQIDALTPEQSLALFDSIVGLQERATKMRDEKAAAERERDRRFPLCGCGKPATLAGFFLWDEVSIEPGIARKGGHLRGGVMFVGEIEGENAPEQEDTKRIDDTLWVTCGDCKTFRAIENGFDLKVGEKW